MELTESRSLPVPQQQAWEALNDATVLKACIPGCESIEADGEHAWAVALTAAVGPVKARFRGRLALTDIDAPSRYTIQFEGQGGVAGFGKGNARVRLEPALDDTTTLSYTASAQIGGKLAQIGSRLIDGAARKIAEEFFRRFNAQLGVLDSADEDAEVDANADAGTAPAQTSDVTGEDSGSDVQTRKRSWTAWISRS
ncbi:CoxG family protein [Paraburkholderia denitrificans]|uniref:CoxG family protein n=1 Tax=Paraburkholderia denitrificans TaxID=694025 RepID=A0ABW0J8H0_9BURK